MTRSSIDDTFARTSQLRKQTNEMLQWFHARLKNKHWTTLIMGVFIRGVALSFYMTLKHSHSDSAKRILNEEGRTVLTHCSWRGRLNELKDWVVVIRVSP